MHETQERVVDLARGQVRQRHRRQRTVVAPAGPDLNVPGLPDNLAFRDFDQAPFAAAGWWLRRGPFRAHAEKKIASYRIKTPGPDVDVAELNAAKSAYLSSFTFGSTAWLAATLAELEMQGLDVDWLRDVETQVTAIDAAKIRALAQQHLDPDASLVAVGDLNQIRSKLQWAGELRSYYVEEER